MDMLDVTNLALDRIYDAFSPRTRTPDEHYREDTSRRLDGMSDIEERRTIQHWLCMRPNSDDWVAEMLSELDAGKILHNFAAGDDAENGRLIARRILDLRDTVNNDEKYWRDQE